MTNNIGSWLYSSPEQDNGETVSFPTDIYSFGLILYFLFEKKDMLSGYRLMNEQNNNNEIITYPLSIEIKKLFKSCINKDQSMRPNIYQAKSIIVDEIVSFVYFEKCLLSENILAYPIYQFIYENISLLCDYSEKIENYSKLLYHFEILNKNNFVTDKAKFLENLADFYTTNINQNYLKAAKYYELASKHNNSFAFII